MDARKNDKATSRECQLACRVGRRVQAGGAHPLGSLLFLSVRAAAAGLIAISAIAASTQLLADALAPTSAMSETVTGASVTAAVFKAPDASVADLKTVVPPDASSLSNAVQPQEVPTSIDLLVRTAMSHRDAPVSSELECMAKAIHHEAGNQPLKGQLAVAQVIRNRARSGRFPKSYCAVVNQPGQFFSTAKYTVTDARRWQTALAVARLAEQQSTPQMAPGALFFHANYTRPDWSHHQLVTQIGAHLFYR